MILPVLCCLAAAAMLTGCNNKAAQKAALEQELARQQAIVDSLEAVANEVANEKEATAMEKIKTLPDEPVFSIVTNLGTIKVKLYKDTPKHRENFAKLALTGYYDSLLFHRVINGFMIQGGDPYTRDTSAAAVQKYGQGGPVTPFPPNSFPRTNTRKVRWRRPGAAMRPTRTRNRPVRSSTSSRMRPPAPSWMERIPFSVRQLRASMSSTGSPRWQRICVTVRSRMSASKKSVWKKNDENAMENATERHCFCCIESRIVFS